MLKVLVCSEEREGADVNLSRPSSSFLARLVKQILSPGCAGLDGNPWLESSTPFTKRYVGHQSIPFGKNHDFIRKRTGEGIISNLWKARPFTFLLSSFDLRNSFRVLRILIAGLIA